MIQINKKWGVKRSKYCVSLCKSFMVKGEKEWRDMFFYNDIPAALEKLVDMSVLRGLDQGSWESVISELQAVRGEISAVRGLLKG